MTQFVSPPSPFRIATWNVNGIRARHGEVHDWIERERPAIVCLQEIKATSDQVPLALFEMQGYWCYYHGGKGYSGVALHVSHDICPDRPAFAHPAFDYESRIVTVEIGSLTIASIYVPNGGKDFAAKMRFLEALVAYAQDFAAAGRSVVLCGDLNVARTERDVHPKERKPRAIGQLPEERALIERLIGCNLTDVGRDVDPDNDNLFTWWAPWRNLRQRNIGWRLDYVLASRSLTAGPLTCIVQREVGTSDHAPVIASFAAGGHTA
ncbi:MAG TPA: exodeoxyribonuclease III [Vicinamibacterales bacterium]|jgi:exodeoxyribonuclease-3|nr:exodeoxyribonuclease III [Vicinamibacterales bacterium]